MATDLEQARQHVAKAEALVMKQRMLLRRLENAGLETFHAAATLRTFEASLVVMRRHLEVEERAAAGGGGNGQVA